MQVRKKERLNSTNNYGATGGAAISHHQSLLVYHCKLEPLHPIHQKYKKINSLMN